MNTISTQELKMKLDQGQPVQLMMALDRNSFERQHIPASLNFDTYQDAATSLSPDQEVIVYCTNQNCPASYRAYYLLRSRGFQKIARYSGGLEEWVTAGLPVEGSQN